MSQRVLSGLLVLALGLAVAPATARAEGAGDLAGTWKREDGKLYRFELVDGELRGKMLNPPVNDDTKLPYSVEIALKLEGEKVEGKATWTEPNPKKGQPGQADSWQATAKWELSVSAPGKLKGRTEYLEWAQGNVSDRGFDEHTFEIKTAVTLGGAGNGPIAVEAGNAIDAAALAGTWRLGAGDYVTFKAADAGFTLQRAKGEGSFPTETRLTIDGNRLAGIAKFGAIETKVELRLASAGHLEGRAERVDGEGADAARGWAPLALERLARIDAPDAPAEAPALGTGSGATDLALDWKREDGLYLRLTAKDGGFEGDLVSKAEGVKGHVTLSPGAEGRFTGKCTWKLEGGPVETTWEVAPAADGSLDARCEWIEWDGTAKAAATKGFSAHKFKALKKIG